MPTNDFLGDALEDFGNTNMSTSATQSGGAPSFLDEAIDAVGAQSKARNYATALNTMAADPDKFAKYEELGTRYGFDPSFVGRNFEALDKQSNVDDVVSLLDYNPILGRWFAQGDNASSIKVDELRHLSGISWLGAAAFDSFRDGLKTTRLADLRYKQLFGQATDDDITTIEAINKDREPRTYAADSVINRGWTGTFNQLPTLYETTLGAIKGALVGATVSAGGAVVAGQLGPQVAAPEEIVTVPVAALWGARVGGGAGAFEASFRQQSGLAFDEFMTMRDEDGKALDPDVARVAALITGGINGGLELVGMNAMAKVIPGFDKISGSLTGDAVKTALAKPMFRDAFTNFAKNTAKVMGTETATEVAQEAITMFAGLLAQEASGQNFAPLSGEAAMDRLSGAFVQTLETMVVMGPMLSSTRLGSDVARARRSSQSQLVIDAITDHAQADELVKRLPDKAREAVRAMTDGGQVQSVFISPETFKTFFQDTAELERFTTEIGIFDEFSEADAIGRDVEVPIDLYYTRIAATNFGDTIRRDVKLSPDDMTANAADIFNEAWQETQSQLAKQMRDRQERDKASLSSSETVHADVKGRVMDAGITPDQADQYAALYSTFFRVLGERTGQDPATLYSRYGLDVRRALPGTAPYRDVDGLSMALEMIKRGRIPGVRKQVEKARGTSMLARIQQRGGIEDTGGELAAMNAGNIIREAVAGGADLLGAIAGENTFTADDTTRQLWEEGYFPEFQERPEINALFDAIGAEIAGEPRYSVQQDQSNTPEMQRAADLIAFADMLDELGLDPNKIDETDIRAELDRLTNDDPTTAALFQSTMEALDTAEAHTFMQEEDGPEKTKRGSIQFGDGKTIINLFEQSNLSTFLHESGHFFLEVFRDAALHERGRNEDGKSGVLADWEATKEYLGITDEMEIGRDAHEKFARSFEVYLFEGKAPSNEVAGFMGRFRSWLVFVYKQISNLDAPINNRIRGVMDRLIATDDEISSAQFSPDFQPLFKNAEDAGMTPEQYEDYIAVAGRSVERAKREMTAKMLDDLSRQTTREYREARRDIRASVQAEMERQPVYQVINYLKTGATEGPLSGVDRLYLDKASVEATMGDGSLYKLPRAVPPVYRAKGGVHPDVIAEFFGFQSGHDMLTRMMSVEPMARAINAETDRRMRDRYGDLMGDTVARAREAAAAISNDETGKLLEREMEVLMKKGLVTSKIRKEDAQRIAANTIRSKPIREALRVRLYQQAAMRAADEAQRAAMSGKWKEAVGAKQKQLLSHYMAQEAIKVDRETSTAVNYLNRFTGRKRPNNIDPEYLDQIEQLLEKFDMRKSITLKQSQRRASLAAWIEQQEAIGNVVTLPEGIRDDAFRKPYKEMNIDDLLTVRDAVKNIEHLGKLKDQLLANKERREFQASRDELVASIAASADTKKDPKTRNPTAMDGLFSFGRSLEAMLIKMEQAFEWMDNGDTNGPFSRYIWRPISEAQARETKMQTEYAGKVQRIFAKLDKTRMAERVTISGLDRTFLRSDIMAVALNMGSESNLDKMMRGEGWDKSPAILDRVVSHLNDAEWNAVQEIWDTINELWPEIKAVQKRLTGVEPPKVESRKFTTANGLKMRGGYYPMMYDPKQVSIATAEGRAVIRANAETDRRIAENDRVMFENVYLRPETRHGFTKERAQQFTMPLLFDLDGLPRHLNAVIHDITHREAIMDANKLLADPFVRGEMEARYSREIYSQVVPWLQNIAHDAYKRDGQAPVDRFFRGSRSRATIVAMGFRVSTVLAQIAGITPSIEVLIPSGSKGFEGTVSATKAVAGAMKDFYSSPLQMWEEINSKSAEMRERMSTLDRDIRDKVRELTGQNTLSARAQRFSMYGIGYMDRAVSAPTWLAAYRLHLKDAPTDEAGAVAAGDRAVRLSQGAGGAKDLAAVQRNSELIKLVTMFYSYFSAYYNRQRTWGMDAKKAIMAGEYRELPDLLARQVFMTIIPAIMGELLVGRGPDDDDDEGFAAWAVKKAILYPFAAVPVLRDAIPVIFGDSFGGYSLSPVERTISDALVKPLSLVGDIVTGEDVNARRSTRDLINATGLWFNLPTGQLATSVNNVWLGIEQDDFQLRDIVLSRPEKR